MLRTDSLAARMVADEGIFMIDYDKVVSCTFTQRRADISVSDPYLLEIRLEDESGKCEYVSIWSKTEVELKVEDGEPTLRTKLYNSGDAELMALASSLTDAQLERLPHLMDMMEHIK